MRRLLPMASKPRRSSNTKDDDSFATLLPLYRAGVSIVFELLDCQAVKDS